LPHPLLLRHPAGFRPPGRLSRAAGHRSGGGHRGLRCQLLSSPRLGLGIRRQGDPAQGTPHGTGRFRQTVPGLRADDQHASPLRRARPARVPAPLRGSYEVNAAKAAEERKARNPAAKGVAPVALNGERFELKDGAVLIAAITSCTNTSNPSVMLGAGLLARKARERGLKAKPWVKTSLAPGSRVVTDYFAKAGVLDDLAAVGFNLVGYGCTTCIGNSGPL